jgi:hypothetical protein
LFEDLHHAPPQFKKSAPFHVTRNDVVFFPQLELGFLIESH